MSTKDKNPKKVGKTSIRPLGDRVLIREITSKEQEVTTKSGIIIPNSLKEDSGTKKGEVLEIGTGKYDDGILIPISVKKGETVLFSWGDKIIIDDEEYYIVKESEITAVIE